MGEEALPTPVEKGVLGLGECGKSIEECRDAYRCGWIKCPEKEERDIKLRREDSITTLARKMISYGIEKRTARIRAIEIKLSSGVVLNYPGYKDLHGEGGMNAQTFKNLLIRWNIHPDELKITNSLTGKKVRLIRRHFPQFRRLYRQDIEKKLDFELVEQTQEESTGEGYQYQGYEELKPLEEA